MKTEPYGIPKVTKWPYKKVLNLYKEEFDRVAEYMAAMPRVKMMDAVRSILMQGFRFGPNNEEWLNRECERIGRTRELVLDEVITLYRQALASQRPPMPLNPLSCGTGEPSSVEMDTAAKSSVLVRMPPATVDSGRKRTTATLR